LNLEKGLFQIGKTTWSKGRTYVTNRGSALLFSELCRAVGGMAAPEADPPPF
jgi:hypothetical protein